MKNLAKVERFKCFNLCTQTCPYRLAGSALPSVFGGSERLRKKEFMFLLFKCDFDDNPCRPRMMENKGKNTNRKPSPNTGKVAAVAVGRGKREQKGKRVFYKTIVNTCLSFSNGGKKRSGIE